MATFAGRWTVSRRSPAAGPSSTGISATTICTGTRPRLDAAGNAAIDAAIYAPLAELNGSVSAEHGIGLEKRGKLPLSRSPEEIGAMRLVKRALDPDNR